MTPTPAGSASVDFGVRGTDVDGDAARYERYRDLGDGLFLERVRLNREPNGWLLDLAARSRRPARPALSPADAVGPGRFKAWFLWDQIPMLLSRTTRTLVHRHRHRHADDRRCAAGAGAGHAGGDRAGLRPVRHASSRRRRAGTSPRAGSSTSPTPRADRRRQRPAHEPRRGRSRSAAASATAASSRCRRRPSTSSPTSTPAPSTSRDPVLLRAGYTGSWFHNDVTVADLRQSVPRDRHRRDAVARPPVAGAEQLVHRRQRHGVGQAAVPVARHGLRLGRRAAGRRRPARAADHQLGAADGAARAADGRGRGPDDRR